ncbi:ATP synthase F1 subunit gamma [[Mycoplasma] gypis]|uniref:ATP synthase gamma chain n=1 Tax=[Mycoplasma] gypis TaxID=92404 RepID=A0ABZ2RNI6_9BACT|nr:ATP synthase F1 subunit gamma [[Mycoplasma] gypis]MBN0919375.1 ATP synthase F1 subunit gamma [[Mycoplasma] gypis]
MADLLAIRHRIESVSTTQKITKAMELVATAKLGKTKNDFNQIKVYYDRVKSVFNNLLKHSEDVEYILNRNSDKNIKPKNLYIVIGSDLGLCGAYNANIVKTIRETIDENSLLIVLGSKLVASLANYDSQTIQKFSKIGDKLEYSLAQIISKKIYDVIQEVYISTVNVVYTEYINSITTEVKTKQIFPIVADNIEKSDEGTVDLSMYEPSATKILANSFIIYFEASMFLAMANAKLSEMSSRRTAMENATDNADELINTLQLNYNRSRQAKITEEITEIISGSQS